MERQKKADIKTLLFVISEKIAFVRDFGKNLRFLDQFMHKLQWQLYATLYKYKLPPTCFGGQKTLGYRIKFVFVGGSWVPWTLCFDNPLAIGRKLAGIRTLWLCWSVVISARSATLPCFYVHIVSGQMEQYFTNLDFPEIAEDFPSKTLPLGGNRSCEVAII